MKNIVNLIKSPSQSHITSVTDVMVMLQNQPYIDHVTFNVNRTINIDTNNLFMRTTYPEDWIRQYLTKGFVRFDPILAHAKQNDLPFFWQEIRPSREARPVLIRFAQQGLGSQGYTIPILGEDGRRHVFSLNSSAEPAKWEAFITKEKNHIQEIAYILKEWAIEEMSRTIAEVTNALSPRQTECLAWAGRGKTSKDIAIILDIRELTVRDHLNQAKAKLKAANIAHAVAKAQSYGLISVLFDD